MNGRGFQIVRMKSFDCKKGTSDLVSALGNGSDVGRNNVRYVRGCGLTMTMTYLVCSGDSVVDARYAGFDDVEVS